MKLLHYHLTLIILGLVTASGCVGKIHNLPPAERLLEPGPGVAGPGPGVLAPPPVQPVGGYGGIGGVPCGPGGIAGAQSTSIQLLFSDANQMEGMQIRWDVGALGTFDSEPLVIPGRQNFGENGLYQLKLTNIPGRVGLELYPTIELGAITPRTNAYLAHNAIPIQFTNEDFDQVESANYVTKVVYLPDPEFQQLAQAGLGTLVSTRLDPGIDPIVEADRRGSILAVVRVGNKDIELGGNTFNTVRNAAPVAPGGVRSAAAQQVVPGQFQPTVGFRQAGYPGMAAPVANMPGVQPYPVVGVNMPTWGYPSVGTPIGLPGPPHIPLGHAAGLHTHIMKNHTRQYIPQPVGKFKIDVKQQPGYTYPRPVSHMKIYEQNIHLPQWYKQPFHNKHQAVGLQHPHGGMMPGSHH